MNTAITYEDLPKVEKEVADLYAWGMTKKEIASKRGKSIRTIENQIRKLFEKTETKKDTEFTSWYFCTRFKISFQFSPFARVLTTACFLLIISINIFNENNDNNFLRVRSARCRVSRTETRRKD